MCQQDDAPDPVVRFYLHLKLFGMFQIQWIQKAMLQFSDTGEDLKCSCIFYADKHLQFLLLRSVHSEFSEQTQVLDRELAWMVT